MKEGSLSQNVQLIDSSGFTKQIMPRNSKGTTGGRLTGIKVEMAQKEKTTKGIERSTNPVRGQ